MKIVNTGYNYRHSENFIIDRPCGTGDYILIAYKTSAFIVLDGKRCDVKPNSVIVFKKGTPQYYGASGCEFCNDWIHFELSEGEESEFTKLGIPFDTVFEAVNVPIITEYIKNIFVERYSENPHREESLSLFFRLILLKLSEAANRHTKSMERPYYESLLRLKSEISDFPEKQRTVDSISKDLSLSRSYIQHLYKEYFGMSLTDNIKYSRMECAKHLLSGTKMTVSDVSRSCGYNSEVHFMRMFKKTVGVSPSEYRKSTAVLQNELETGKRLPPFSLDEI